MEHEANDMKQCQYCAEPIRREAIKCRYCGSMLTNREAPAGTSSALGYWQRVNEGKRIAGVCTGIARQLEMPVLVLPLRLFFVLTTIFYFFGVLLYIILWLLMPPPVDGVRPSASDAARPSDTPRRKPDPAAADRTADPVTEEPPPESEPTASDERERSGDDDIPPVSEGGDAADDDGDAADDWNMETASTAPEPPSLDDTVPVEEKPPQTPDEHTKENGGDNLARFMLTMPGMVTVGCVLAALYLGWMFAIQELKFLSFGYMTFLVGGLVVAVIGDMIVRRSGNTIAHPYVG